MLQMTSVHKTKFVQPPGKLRTCVSGVENDIAQHARSATMCPCAGGCSGGNGISRDMGPSKLSSQASLRNHANTI